jgi:hypothetical protein
MNCAAARMAEAAGVVSTDDAVRNFRLRKPRARQAQAASVVLFKSTQLKEEIASPQTVGGVHLEQPSDGPHVAGHFARGPFHHP